MRAGRRLTGFVSTRVGVIVTGYKTKFGVDPGLEDVIVPIATAQTNALGRRATASVYVSHSNRQPMSALPDSLRYLNYGNASRRGLVPVIDNYNNDL